MALTPSFTVGQSALTPNIITVTDTSTGSNVAITQRRVFVTDAYGNYLVPAGTTTDYTYWQYSASSIDLNILTEDAAASVLVQWLDVNDAVIDSVNNNAYAFTEYSKQFAYSLVQDLGLEPGTLQDVNYSSNLAILWANIKGAINAAEYGNDLAAAQNCLNRCNALRLNQALAF